MAEELDIRQKRREEVYRCVERAGQDGASIKEVSKCMNFKRVTPYLTDLLKECEERGWLYKQPSIIQTERGARMGWRYFANQ